MTIRPASVPTSHSPAEPSATLIGIGRGRPGTLVAAAIAGAAKAHSKRTRRRIAPRVWSKPGPKSGSRLASARASTRPMSPAPSPKGSTRPAAVVRDHRAPARGQDGGHDRVGGQRAVPPKRPALAARGRNAPGRTQAPRRRHPREGQGKVPRPRQAPPAESSAPALNCEAIPHWISSTTGRWANSWNHHRRRGVVIG